jgi:hypothetical protein
LPSRTARPEGEEIGSRVKPFTARLFGRHICDGSERRAWARQFGFDRYRRERRRACRRGLQLRETEVEQLRVPTRRDEDVRGLDIAVHNGGAMRRIQRIGDVDADPKQFVQRRHAFSEAFAERFAVEPFHGDERNAVVLEDLVNRADVWVIEC